MKKYFLLTFLLFQIVSVGASKKDSVKCFIGLSGGWQQLGKLTNPSYFNHQYTSGNGIDYGLDLGFQFNKYISLDLGIHQFSIQYDYAYSWIFIQANDPSIPKIDEYNNQYLDFPILINANLIVKNKWSLFFSSGMAASFLNKNSSETTYQDNSAKPNIKSEPFLLSYKINLGIDFKIKEKSKITIWGSYRQFISLLDSDMITKPNIFSAHLGFSSRIEWKCIFKKGAWRPLPICK